MTAHTALNWWSAAQLAGLAGRLGEVVCDWKRDWQSTGPVVVPTARNVLQSDDITGTSWSRLGDATETGVWFDDSSLTVDAVCRDLFGASSGTPVMRALGESARLDLVARLCLCLSVNPSSRGAPARAPTVGPWMGYVDLLLPLGDRTTRLLLNAPCILGLVECEPHARQEVCPRPVTEAMQLLEVCLEVRLRDVELEVEDLQSLVAGDLVVLDHALTQPLSIHACESAIRLPCDAYLGKLGECKAVQLHIQTVPAESEERHDHIH